MNTHQRLSHFIRSFKRLSEAVITIFINNHTQEDEKQSNKYFRASSEMQSTGQRTINVKCLYCIALEQVLSVSY